jgi:transposase
MSRIVKSNVLAVIWLNNGEQFKFSLALDSKYGKGTAEDLLCKAIKTLKIMPHEYKEKISYYKSLVENLLKEKGLSLKK